MKILFQRHQSDARIFPITLLWFHIANLYSVRGKWTCRQSIADVAVNCRRSVRAGVWSRVEYFETKNAEEKYLTVLSKK